MARSLDELIAFRALQGLGGGGLIGVVLRLPARERRARMDWPGAGLLVAAVTCAILVSSWGGAEAPWGSPHILGLAAAALLAFAGFVVVERRTREPLLLLDLFANPVVSVTSAVGCLAGVVLFGSIVFLPLFLQVAKGMSATSSGLLVMPLMVGVLVASVVSGRLVTRTGRYKPFPIVGAALMAVAFSLLSLLRASTPSSLIIGEMFLLGIGIGPLMQVLILASQNAVSQRHLGLVTSLAQFFRELGGTFGVALFGALFSARLSAELAMRLPGRGSVGAGGLAATPQGSPAGLRSLPPAVHHAIVESVARSVGTVFHWAVPFAVVAFLLTLGLRELPLRDTVDHATPGATPGGEVSTP